MARSLPDKISFIEPMYAQRKAFLNDTDYGAYLERLGRYRRRYDYTIHTYCLMPNHVHLLVERSREPLAKFMQGLQQVL